MDTRRDPQTWAQSIQEYQRDKTHLAWNQAELPPPTYVKQYDVSRKSREVDPILMRHRDPAVEAQRKHREQERVRVTLNKARNRQLKAEQNYDIVSHTSHSGKKEPVARLARHPDSRTPYDILNHVSREQAHSLALIYPEGESPEVLPQKSTMLESGKKPHSHKGRDVDVLSNRFLEKHDERMVEEKRFLRERANEVFRRTRDYNPIAGRYYDEAKEQDFVRSREKFGALQGQAQRYRLPPSVRYIEGNDYDIISKQPKSTTQTVPVADRGLTKRCRGRQAHEENVRQHERQHERADQRILNRPSHMRHVEVLRTGHDVISNQVFTGRQGRPPAKPRARPPAPVWDRLSGPEVSTWLGSQGVAEKASTHRGGEEQGQDEKKGGDRGGGEGGGDHKGDSYGAENSGSGSRGRGNEVNDIVVGSGRRLERDNRVNEALSGGRERGETGAAAKSSTQIVPPLDLSRKPETGVV